MSGQRWRTVSWEHEWDKEANIWQATSNTQIFFFFFYFYKLTANVLFSFILKHFLECSIGNYQTGLILHTAPSVCACRNTRNQTAISQQGQAQHVQWLRSQILVESHRCLTEFKSCRPSSIPSWLLGCRWGKKNVWLFAAASEPFG